MARREGLQSSLFPFMSVLACTIGSLVVLLAVMSLSAVGATGAAEQDFAESRAARTAEALVLESQRETIEAAEALWAEVDRALEARGLTPGQTVFDLSRSIEAARSERDARATRRRLERDLAQLESEREAVEATIDVLESRRETLPILIDPTGLSPRTEPYFIECDEGGATAYRATDDLRYFVPREELGTHGDFGRYLRRVRALPGALLVLLVRPDGLETMQRIESIASQASIRVARLPLPGTGELDWSLLRRAEGAG